MIKVNLLKDQTVSVRSPVEEPRVSRQGLIFLAIFLLLAGGMGFWWYYLNSQIKELTQTREELRVEEARLQALKAEIAKYDQMKQLRLSKIEVIETLKENQTGPVVLLNSVIKSMPGDGSLWLTELEQQEEKIKVMGYTLRQERIPDFMINLVATGFFQEVDLETMEREEDASMFSLLCKSMRKPQPELENGTE